jgi:hypothetical protein
MHAASVVVRSLWVRFHMGLILVAVLVSGVVASRQLLHLGVRSMAVRYPVAALAGYLLFFVGVRVWLWYARLSLPREFEQQLVKVEEGKMDPAVPPPETGRGWAECDGIDLPFDADPEGCLASVVVFILLVALFGAAAYTIAEAPGILGEAIVQVVLAASLRRRASAINQPHWSGSVLRATWVPALITIIVACLGGYLLQVHCPSAARLLDVIHCG